MNGILDFITGGGQYADPNAMHPVYGVPQSDVRQALLNSMMSAGASLLAAGQPIAPAQRAQLLGQAGAAFGNVGTDVYNAAQRRLMQQQFEARRGEIESDRQLAEMAKNPIDFRARYGFDPSGLSAKDIREILSKQRQEAALDPEAAERRRVQGELQRVQLTTAQQALTRPTVTEAGGVLYRIDPRTGAATQLTSPRETGGLEGQAQSILLMGARNPAIRDTPEYAIAYNRLFAPRTEIRNGELVTIVPPAPPGILPPTGGVAPAPQPPAGAQPGTVTQVPGGGTITQTQLGPRRLSPAELQLKQETEDAIAATAGARSGLLEALRLSREAYSGPLAAPLAAGAAMLPGEQRAAVATRELGSLMTEQTLSQLRTIFGGNPTEGERKILDSMQASVRMTRPEREALIARALEAVERRLPSLQSRLEQVAGGTYGQVTQPGQTPAAPPQDAAQAAAVNRLLRSADLNTLRQVDVNSLAAEQKQLLLQRLRELGGQ